MTTTLPAYLEQAVRDALPEGCEVTKQCGHLCGQTPAWSVQLHCGCESDDTALICDDHVLFARTADFVCQYCSEPCSVIAVRRL